MKNTITIPNNYRCLVVEDSTFRHGYFRAWMPSCTIAANPTDAINLLRDRKFDMVFLDHDCAGDKFVSRDDPDYLNKTFWRVAQQLHRDEFKGEIVIHSGNPIGAKRMYNLLLETCHPFIAPFGSFDIKLGD